MEGYSSRLHVVYAPRKDCRECEDMKTFGGPVGGPAIVGEST